MDTKPSLGSYVWKVAASHTVAYFVAGLFAVLVMNYKDHYASQSLSLLMRPIDSPWVAVGPGLQLIRGGLLALVLWPFKKTFLEETHGGWKLALLILGLSALSTIGPTPGSFEGVIYTKLPLAYHLLGIPETLLYVALFSGLVVPWHKHPRKSYQVVSVILVGLVLLMSGLGVLQALGMLRQ